MNVYTIYAHQQYKLKLQVTCVLAKFNPGEMIVVIPVLFVHVIVYSIHDVSINW